MKKAIIVLVSIFVIACNYVGAQIPYPGKNPGQAKVASLSSGQVVLENEVLKMEFANDGKVIRISGFTDKNENGGIRIKPGSLFELKLNDSTILTSEDFSLVDPAVTGDITGNNLASSYGERLPGKKFSACLENKKAGISVHWEADLRDGSNYVRQIFRVKDNDANPVSKITLLKFPVQKGIRKVGTVDGSPIILQNMFFALEYPLSRMEENKATICVFLPGIMDEVTTVWGVTPSGQLRRGFLYYVERERAHPYHQVLHYNSWFDISWDDRKFTENECLDRIRMFGDSLITKRHIPMQGFLFDDGWDDNKTLWQFHPGFPEGFSKLKQAAKSYNSDIGVWLSPFGGYGNAKRLRIEYGNLQNPPFETNEQGFSLAGPVYFNRFKNVTADFIRKYDVSMFKFDGVGAGNGAGVAYRKDVEAFLRLLDGLLTLKPEIYLSLTTGTWPSVYWLAYGDNIWRGGDDTNMQGEGSTRQQWITYRDADVYKNIVERGPLFPLNSLMTCGICIADHGNPEKFEMNDQDISDEIWSFFATGTNLQELYINPHMLSTANWNCLAEAGRWAKENEKLMTDVHWIGGDPSKGEIYGFASWSKEKAVFSLRNPTAVEKTFEVSTGRIFEPPDNPECSYLFYNVRTRNESGEKKVSASGKTFTISLKPFEIMVFDAIPRL